MNDHACPCCIVFGPKPGSAHSLPTVAEMEAFAEKFAAELKARKDEEYAKQSPTILYSLGRRLYYITDPAIEVATQRRQRPQGWLGVNLGDDGVYDYKPFSFWKVEAERNPLPIQRDDPLYIRYAEIEGWGATKETDR